MLTYPSTHGVYEADVREVCGKVHDAGGQVYVDGANLNAIAGRRVLKCVHCGNIRDEEDKDRRVSSYAPGAQPASAAALVEPRRRPVSPAARREDRSAPAKRPARRLPIAWILGAIALVLGLAASFLVTWTVEQTVAATSWERRIAVEEFRTLTQEDWDPPSDARILDRETRIRTHRQVIDRYASTTKPEKLTGDIERALAG